MGKINVLSFAVANLIAAGEVVDRPASVIKELLENAIDSGADRITVEIQNGGVTYMRVSDNGCGMEPEDIPVAIRRHATSKIRDAEDLDGIMTLGFRGEALAAIASVSDLRIISKTADAAVGAMLEAHGGEIVGVTERAASDGTTVIVENLFANVPARRKFLKKDVTEAMAVSSVVERIALSKPQIAFRLISDGTVRLETVGDGNLKHAVYSIFGREFAAGMLPADIELDGIQVTGFVGRPDRVRANRNHQNFFINGRYVKSKTAGAAVEQAYTSYIPSDKFPCCVLFLTVHPSAVDVNVHPAKLEVKFSNEKPIFEAVYYAVKNALEHNTARPELELGQSGRKSSDWTTRRVSDSPVPVSDGKRESLKSRQVEAELFRAAPHAQPSEGGFARMTASDYVKTYLGEESKPPKVISAGMPQTMASPTVQPTPPAPVTVESKTRSAEAISHTMPVVSEPADAVSEKSKAEAEQELVLDRSMQYRIIGEAFHSYVLVERGESILLIDKHAAHERIIFERLKEGLRQTTIHSQMLMLPIEVMMTSDEIQALCDYRDEISAVGFEFTTGTYTASVTAIPEGVEPDAVADMLTVMAERIRSNTGTARLTRDLVFEKALYQASCKAAIKAGREYPPEYVQELVATLMKLPDITVCPHGRPVAMEMKKSQIDRRFERT
ncbi:MAG: DNA mismatch repair endonuclease MutL [Clostridia bacterium]|nr:DNA mismatch repair endonuclease MutL [Clostridia bacterium]